MGGIEQIEALGEGMTMKLLITVSLLFATLAMSGCFAPRDTDTTTGEHDTTGVPKQPEPPTYDYSLFFGEPGSGFIEYLYSNKIDSDMKREENESRMYKTPEIVEFYDKYYAIWEHEMNDVYENLMSELSDETAAKLEKAQAAWQTEHELMQSLWSQTIREGDNWGSGVYISVAAERFNTIRMRTFKLAQYYFELTHGFEFAYEQEALQ